MLDLYLFLQYGFGFACDVSVSKWDLCYLSIGEFSPWLLIVQNKNNTLAWKKETEMYDMTLPQEHYDLHFEKCGSSL